MLELIITHIAHTKRQRSTRSEEWWEDERREREREREREITPSPFVASRVMRALILILACACSAQPLLCSNFTECDSCSVREMITYCKNTIVRIIIYTERAESIERSIASSFFLSFFHAVLLGERMHMVLIWQQPHMPRKFGRLPCSSHEMRWVCSHIHVKCAWK